MSQDPIVQSNEDAFKAAAAEIEPGNVPTVLAYVCRANQLLVGTYNVETKVRD